VTRAGGLAFDEKHRGVGVVRRRQPLRQPRDRSRFAGELQNMHAGIGALYDVR